MAKRLLLRDAENWSADMMQRILGGLTAGIGAASGIGTGYAGGGVGKMNSSWLGATLPTGHLVVTADGTDRILTITPGWATIVRDAGASTFDPRALFAESDANDTVTAPANATGSTRNDTVCMKIDLATAPTTDGSNVVSFEIIAGQSGGGLSNAPADGNLHLPLANVAVANAAASLAQANVTDKRIWLPSDVNPYKARAYNNANQAIAATTFTKVSLQVKDHDANGNFDTTNFRYYAAVPGFYFVSGTVAWAGVLTANTRYVSTLYKNGTELIAARTGVWTSETTGATVLEVPTASPILQLAAGDFIELWCWSSAAQNANGTGLENAALSCHLLSGL